MEMFFFCCLDLLVRCLEKSSKKIIPNGGLMMIYHGKKVQNHPKNTSKFVVSKEVSTPWEKCAGKIKEFIVQPGCSRLGKFTKSDKKQLVKKQHTQKSWTIFEEKQHFGKSLTLLQQHHLKAWSKKWIKPMQLHSGCWGWMLWGSWW